LDDQQEPRRASLGLPRFARSGTPPTHVDDAGASGRPECRKHAEAEARAHTPTAATRRQSRVHHLPHIVAYAEAGAPTSVMNSGSSTKDLK
jgi:hypothetical protein